MKNIKYLILIMTFALVATSCETYDDYNTDVEAVIGFTMITRNINGISEGTTKSINADIYISDISSTDRVFEIIDIPIYNPDEFPPTEGDFSYDATVTIPAGEQKGTIQITGDNTNGKITMDRTYFRLAVKGTDNVASGGYMNIGLRL